MIKYFVEVEWAGLMLRDPVTAFTNVLMFLAGMAAWRRIRTSNPDAFFQRNWSLFFLFVALSSLIGVVVHGFSYYTSESTHMGVWLAMSIVQGFGITYAQRAEANRYINKRHRFLHLFPALQLLLFIIAILVWKNYNVAKIHIALGLIPILIWNAILGFRSLPGTALVAWGIFVSALTAAVHSFKISINPQWFNFNDIAHILIVISLLLMGKGIRMILRNDGVKIP